MDIVQQGIAGKTASECLLEGTLLVLEGVERRGVSLLLSEKRTLSDDGVCFLIVRRGYFTGFLPSAGRFNWGVCIWVCVYGRHFMQAGMDDEVCFF